MRRLVISILLLAMFVPSAYSLSCTDYLDCPAPECPGSMRLCIRYECRQTECIFGSTEELESYSTAFEPYELALNVSKMESSGDLQSGLLSAYGIDNVFSGLGLSLAIMVGAMLVVFLLVFLKSKSKVLFAIGLSVTILLIGVIVMSLVTGDNLVRRILLMGPADWDSMQASDFGLQRELGAPTQARDLSGQLLSTISPRIRYGKSYVFEGQGNVPLSVIIMSLTIAEDMPLFPSSVGGNIGEARYVLGEKIFISKGAFGTSKLIWDENRFVFVVEGAYLQSMDTAATIIQKYPSRPTDSRLKITDNVNPVVVLSSPADGDVGRNFEAVFTLYDSLTGIDIASIESSQGPFNPFRDCVAMNNGTVRCAFYPDFVAGPNTLLISAADEYGNPTSTSVSVTNDIESPLIRVWPDGIISENSLEIDVSDEISGTDSSLIKVWINGESVKVLSCLPATDSWICRLYDVLRPGENSLLVEASDLSGNRVTHRSDIIYDAWPPVISRHEGEGSLGFIVSDRGAGILLSGIRSDIPGFDPQRHCKFVQEQIECAVPGLPNGNHTITAQDIAGKVSQAMLIG